MTRNFRSARVLATASSLAAVVYGAAALAADEPVSALDEAIIVSGEREVPLDAKTQTGSRLGLEIREVPATLDVVTQERFLERGLRSSNEALNSAPGVTAADTGGQPGSMSMRGFGGNAVSINYDGVHQPSSTMVTRNYDSFAFEQIEVLKGPASVLFGEGALGGTVNYVPKKAMLDRMAVQSLAEYGSRNTFRVAGDVNVPLSPIAAVRALVSYAGSDGYIERTPSKTLTANLGITIQPASNLTINLAAEHFSNNNSATYWGTPLVSRAASRQATSVVSSANNGFVLDRALSRTNFQYEDGLVRSDSQWLRSAVNWQINDVWRLRNDLGYNKGDRLWSDAESYSFNAGTGRVSRSPTYIRNVLDFLNERISLSADGPIAGHRNRFLIGYEHSEMDHTSYRRFGASATVDPYAFAPGFFPTFNATNFPGSGNVTDSVAKVVTNAVFGEDAFNLTEKWLLVGGARYEEMKLNRLITDYNLGTSGVFGRMYRPYSWRVGTVYDVLPKTQLFAQYTQGAAPVGTLLLLSLTNTGFNLTKGKSAEVGLKGSFLNDRVNATLSAYWIQQKDIITRDPDFPNDATKQFQGGTQSTRGIEFAIAAAVTKQFRFDANIAVLDARFDQLIEAGGNRAGKTPTNVPETVANFFASYRPDEVPVKATFGVRYSGPVYGDTANTVRAQGYTVFDASVGYIFPFGEVTVRGRNLGNRLYAEWVGSSNVYLAAPRSFDISFRTKF
ncbi:TonB-dependent receptor [Novosphingobium sp. BL-52-GroH]|uniref:TonB-dependent receptor n=1 Tax=Novosphingobium sp. BL-52-GroH TaxID=3349877 RepID=UPI0038509BB6